MTGDEMVAQIKYEMANYLPLPGRRGDFGNIVRKEYNNLRYQQLSKDPTIPWSHTLFDVKVATWMHPNNYARIYGLDTLEEPPLPKQ